MKYWDKVAENKNYYYGDFENPARLMLLKLVKDDESLLDVGCGNGMTYALLMKNWRKIFYKGIDYSQKFIANCQERWPGTTCFEQMADSGMYDIIDSSYDTVYIRHCLENVKDWKKMISEMFRIARKRVIIDMRRGLVNEESRILEDHDDTVCWDINYDEFNEFCRNLSVNVSFCQEPLGDTNTFVVIGKKLGDVVFTLDDFHETNHNLDLLLKLKEDYKNLKVTLFTIPAKSSVGWLRNIKKQYGDWMELAVHGYYHDVAGEPVECSVWTREDALKYLAKAERMFAFVKGFKAPGWQMSEGTYEALKEKGYWIMDHALYKHIRPADFTDYYETGHLWEVNGHIQETPFNGLQSIINNKLNFLPDSNFYFVSEMAGTDRDKERLCHYQDQILTPRS